MRFKFIMIQASQSVLIGKMSRKHTVTFLSDMKYRNMKMSNNPAKYEVLTKNNLIYSILEIHVSGGPL